jgi:hypothetical protein
MKETKEEPKYKDKPTDYSIRIQGHISNDWAHWFGNSSIQWATNGDSYILLTVIDQAELFELLRKIRDSGMKLVSVNKYTKEFHGGKK